MHDAMAAGSIISAQTFSGAAANVYVPVMSMLVSAKVYSCRSP